ncbi:MAG: DMT family transporter [Candidatus Zixiibacteriota bacterium]
MNSAINRNKAKVYLSDAGLFYAAAIWGSTFFIVKDALNHVDPVILVAYRFLIAGLLLWAFLIIKGKSFKTNFREGLLLSVLLYFLYVPQTIGLGYTTASNSGFITGLFVAFVPIFLKMIFKRKPTIMEVIASIISLIGLWILTGGMTVINIGDIITLLAAMTYALHVLYSDKFMKAGFDPVIISAQQFLLVGIMALITGLIFRLPLSVGNTYTWGVIVFLALFPTTSAFLIQMVAQKITSPLKVSLIFALEPVFAGVFAWTLGGEQFVVRSALGGFFIFSALFISGMPVKRKN